MTEHHYNIFADYHQFYLQDEKADGDLSDCWTHEATEQMLALAPGTIGVGTVRNMTVPVTVRVLDAAPADDYDQWDQVNECSLDIPSGSLVIAGCTDYFPDAARIPVVPGSYRARLFYGGLETLNDDGLEGGDHYEIALWPAPPLKASILKSRPTLPLNPIVYDKARYHINESFPKRLSTDQVLVPTGMYLGWIIDHNLHNPAFFEECKELIDKFTRREIQASNIYEYFDGCFDSEMLSPEGNAFTQFYFGVESGEYLKDYEVHLVADRPSLFHVRENAKNYAILTTFIDQRYQDWVSQK
ncbi:hypothetical protein [Capsulimonas corticalis]|nr:hypothetical protein [Capsulimonas corticalis]